MQYTSAQANQLLNKLTSEYAAICAVERESRTFVAATTEKLEDARPPYDYAATQDQLTEIERKIRTVKHAINVFNTTHTVPGFDLTVDQMLVYMGQLQEKIIRLSQMAYVNAKQRLEGTRTNLIEYRYANYDVEKANEDYFALKNELGRARVGLDTLNNSETMEIALEI